MTVTVHIVLNDQTLHLYLVSFKGRIDSSCGSIWRNAIITDQRISADKDLAPIRRIGQRLDVPSHSGIENHFTGDRFRGTKADALHCRAIFEHQGVFCGVVQTSTGVSSGAHSMGKGATRVSCGFVRSYCCNYGPAVKPIFPEKKIDVLTRAFTDKHHFDCLQQDNQVQ